MIDPHLLATAMDQSSEAVIITDRRGRIEYVNAAFGHMMGIAPEDLMDQPIHEYEPRMAGEGWRRSFLDCVARRGKPWREEIREKGWQTGEGIRVVDYSTTPVRVDGRITHFVTIKRDISSRRNLEQQLQQAQKMEVVGALAGGIAHNFNNMLAALNGNVYLLNSMLDGEWDAAKARAKLDAMNGVIMRAAEHIRGLLSFARKGRMDVKVFPLAPLVKETLKLAASGVPEAIRLETDVPADDDLLVNSDAAQLQQALLNLINNAVDALEDVEQALIRVEVAAVDRAGKRHACITVTDNGCGMPQHLLTKVCDPYFTTKQPGKGTGLGLAMVSGMADQCKGMFSIESLKGKGTTVRLCLPLEKHEQLSSSDMPAMAEAVTGRGACVLWVDDDDDVRETGAEALRSAGFHVLTAVDGQDALNVFLERRGEIHAAVMDVIMPEMGGVKAARRMNEVRPSLPIILMSGYDSSGEAQTACDEGICEGVISKPVQPGQLAAMLQSLIHD
ncbi:MAG: ATP-binding protein [Mariprofundaceae bacterium]|nr:ATP-binding protein [Mariprofundaceae bacterium]